jgi:hypothetical protein
MLTQLTTVKTRLALDPLDITNDALLTSAILAVSARFDQETNRTLERTENATFEFAAADTEIVVPCYPIELVAKFELKSSEPEGWVEQSGVSYLLRRACVLHLLSPLATIHSPLPIGRVTYTGGFLVPGSAPQPGAAALPADLEQAAIEQTAFWFQTRDMVGVLRQWPHGGDYEQLADLDLLPSVRAVLAHHTRMVL